MALTSMHFRIHTVQIFISFMVGAMNLNLFEKERQLAEAHANV
jgi:hypothetical protein